MVVDVGGIAELQGIEVNGDDGDADRGDDEALGAGEPPGGKCAVSNPGGGVGPSGIATDPPPGNAGRQCEPGHALLVLPQWVARATEREETPAMRMHRMH